MRRIGGLLGRSPWGPIYEQTAKVVTCVAEVPKMIHSLVDGKKEAVAKSIEAIHALEHQADEVKIAIRDRLSNSLFSSVERSETLYLVKMVDSISDLSEKVAKIVSIRWTNVPEDIGPLLIELAEMAHDSARRVSRIARTLRNVMEGNSTRDDTGELLTEITDLGAFNFKVEQKEIEALKRLFEHEDCCGAIDLMFLMRIIGEVARISRQSENVADAIRRIVLNR